MSLQGIGTFSLDTPLPEVTDTDKPVVIPANAVSFQYNPKVGEEESIVDFIVAHTKKIKPLASADLDSFLTLGRQFLNIGKPFTIQNLGTLEKLTSGELEFRPGQLILQKVETPKDITENENEENDTENLFNDYQGKRPRSANGKGILLTFLILIVLGVGAWASWKYFFTNKNQEPSQSENIVPLTDTLAATNDSLARDSIPINATAMSLKPLTDTVAFNVVVGTYVTKEAAIARLAKLENFGRKVIMYTSDSLTFKVAHPFMLPLADTTKILDSLNRHFYLGKAHIEIP